MDIEDPFLAFILFLHFYCLSHICRFFSRVCFPAGFFAIAVSAVAVLAASYQGVDLTYIHSNFLQLATATLLISVLLSVYLYVRSRNATPDQLALGGNSGKGNTHTVVGSFFILPFLDWCLLFTLV